MLDVLTLRSVFTTYGDKAEAIETVVTIDVFCEPKGVKRSEFYQAQAAGQQVDAIFEVNSDEYNEQMEAEYNGIKYKIARTYPLNMTRTELVCRRIQ